MIGKHGGAFGCGQDLRGDDGCGVCAGRAGLELPSEPTPSAMVDEHSAARERAMLEMTSAVRDLAEALRSSPIFGLGTVDLDDDLDDDLDEDLCFTL